MGKKIKITIAVALIVLSIPFCTRWFSTVEYYFSDERKQATSSLATSSLKYRLTGTSTVEVAGLEEYWTRKIPKDWTRKIIIPEKTIYCGYLCTVTSIGKEAFFRSGLTIIKIPSSVTKIGYKAFEDCSGLKSVEIPSSVTEIGNYTFSGCSSLESVEIPSSVTEIGEGAFRRCSRLKSVKIPSSVTKIGYEAFEYCHNLNIVIDNRENNVIVGHNAFDGCKSVTWKKDK